MKLRTMAKAQPYAPAPSAKRKRNQFMGAEKRHQTAWAMRRTNARNEQSKTNGSDPVYALERSIELISSKGRTN